VAAVNVVTERGRWLVALHERGFQDGFGDREDEEVLLGLLPYATEAEVDAYLMGYEAGREFREQDGVE